MKRFVGSLFFLLIICMVGCGTDEKQNVNEESINKEQVLNIVAPEGEVMPCADAVKSYLMAGEGASVTAHHSSMKNQAIETKIAWKSTCDDVKMYEIQYATKADYSDAIQIQTEPTERNVFVSNLYKDTTYYVKVSAIRNDGTVKSAESTFQTTSLGPRFMAIDGICNVRDVGGYQIATGEKTKQGMIFRGGALQPTTSYRNIKLSEEGATYMSEVLHIQLELDLRNEAEAGGHTESAIPGARLQYITVDGYASAFSENYKNAYCEVFQTLAKEENYPVYIHCTGGADRTGTVCFLLNAMLGVSETELIQDYESTSFSRYGIRDSQNGEYATYFKAFRDGLDEYQGETLSEKAESYLLSIGVTQAEIANIKNIMVVHSEE